MLRFVVGVYRRNLIRLINQPDEKIGKSDILTKNRLYIDYNEYINAEEISSESLSVSDKENETGTTGRSMIVDRPW